MILSSTSPYALLKEFSIAFGFKYDAVFFAFFSIISVNSCRCCNNTFFFYKNTKILPSLNILIKTGVFSLK